MSSVSEAPAVTHRQSAGQELVCQCCGSSRMRVFHEIRNVPTNSCILLSTRDEALSYPLGDIRLAFCEACGFISNVAFVPELTEYSGRYEETQAFSPTFNSFHEKLARSLVDRHGLRDKELIEIGCGKGEFLRLLCTLGSNRGLGFDPGYSEARGEAQGAAGFRVVRDFFSDRYIDNKADFVCCKMTLEHIPAPLGFMRSAVETARRPDGIVFIQVPESLRIVRDCAFEDIYYEHCSYFSAGSLGRLFERLGLRVLETSVEYDGQYLTVEATRAEAAAGAPASAAADDMAMLAAHVAAFPDRIRRKLVQWEESLARWRADGKRVVIWGSGSKGVSFLTAVGGAAETVAHAVDINPYRRGYFMPGTGQEILSPEQLPALQPDVVIVMNSVYVPEIKAKLAQLGLTPEVHAL
jgi:SAM-dependent methyltransferase